MAWQIFDLKKEDGVAIATMTRDPGNTYNLALMHELDEVIEDVRFDTDVKVMVLTGGGDKFFSAGADINMLNIIAVPLILGIGIDDAVHMIHRYRIEGGGRKIDAVINTTGRAILLTSLTTVAAFGSFMFSLYRGMSTTGIILSIGITVCFFSSVYFLPALIRLAEKLRFNLGKEVDHDIPGK